MVPKEMQEQKQMTCVGEEKKEDGTEGGRCQTSYTDDRPSSTGAALPRPTVLLRPPPPHRAVPKSLDAAACTKGSRTLRDPALAPGGGRARGGG